MSVSIAPAAAAVADDEKRVKDEVGVREKAVDTEQKRVDAEEAARIKVRGGSGCAIARPPHGAIATTRPPSIVRTARERMRL